MARTDPKPGQAGALDFHQMARRSPCKNFCMPLTAIQLQELRRLLAERRNELLEETRDDVGRSRDESYSELATSVHDAGDEAQASLLADLDQAEISRDLNAIREIDAAEARIADASYGTCAECGGDAMPGLPAGAREDLRAPGRAEALAGIQVNRLPAREAA
jgi:RNA polymerase-binding transcription factor DksA